METLETSLPAVQYSAFPAHVKPVDRRSDLMTLRDPNINLVIWMRQLPDGLECLWDRLRTTPLPLAGDWIAPDECTLRADLQKFARESVFAHAIEWLAADICALWRIYSVSTGASHPRVRLERVEDGACVLFHQDHMEARIICTYAGPGMQWVANEDADRSQLGLRGRSVAEANRAIVRDDSRIRTIPSGWVAFFKGALHPNNRAGALIHRSAPVSGPEEFRIRLCIDNTASDEC